MLALSNLRLHKIASNSPVLMEAFPTDDRAKDIKDLNLFTVDLPLTAQSRSVLEHHSRHIHIPSHRQQEAIHTQGNALYG